MQIQQIRRHRLRQLIHEQYDKSQAKFIDDTGENQGEISALLRNKSFGEKKARKIEQKAGKPSGWLDIWDEAAQEFFAANQEDGTRPPADAQPSESSASQESKKVNSERAARHPTLVPADHIDKGKVALVYVDMDELALLTGYRQATESAQETIRISVETSEKRFA